MARVSTSFLLLLNNIHVRMDHVVFIHSSLKDIWVVSTLAMVSNATMNIHIQGLCESFSFLTVGSVLLTSSSPTLEDCVVHGRRTVCCRARMLCWVASDTILNVPDSAPSPVAAIQAESIVLKSRKL